MRPDSANMLGHGKRCGPTLLYLIVGSLAAITLVAFGCREVIGMLARSRAALQYEALSQLPIWLISIAVLIVITVALTLIALLLARRQAFVAKLASAAVQSMGEPVLIIDKRERIRLVNRRL